MTESQQSQRGWFSSWREQRAAKRQEAVERARFDREHDSEHGGPYRRRGRASQHSGAAMWFGSGGFGGDGGGGGCGGDGGGGGGC